MAVSLLEVRRQILLNTPHIESASGSIATFNTDLSANLTDMKIYFHPVQEGTGDPSPDNIRPIHGWDGLTVIKTGKNLANLSESEMLSYSWTKAFPNPFRKPGRYTISCQNNIVTGSQSGAYVFLGNAVTDSSGYGLTSWGFGKTGRIVSFNITAEALERKYIVFRFNSYPNYASLSNAQIQIEEGSEATEYEMPPLEIPISFPQTIYGGYIDLVKDEVVEEWAIDIYTDSDEWVATTLSGQPAFQVSRKQIPTSATFVSNLIKRVSSLSSDIDNSGYAGGRYLNVKMTSAETVDEFKTLLGADQLQIAYNLTTPIHHTINLQNLKALKGINNIWSSANGDIEVKFWVH